MTGVIERGTTNDRADRVSLERLTKMSEKKEVRFTVETKTAAEIAKYADKHDITVSEAVDRMIHGHTGRLAAIARYAKNKKDSGAPAKPRAARKPAAKKPAKKRAAKAKRAASSTANGAAQVSA